ncbi:hypothetical protein [Stigmatella aurantiaca]|nr:hypothetical protein [Stigmatella aurantiaca]EAU69277.1 conserved hypothetical protein [Stigmatella aurantiaca DW4/3-1]
MKKAATKRTVRKKQSPRPPSPRRRKVCSLKEALSYHNEKVLRRFLDIYAIPEEEARELFQETKKWLWLCARSLEEKGPRLAVQTSLLMVDEMWHTFMQYTLDYQRYCLDRFGTFIHHLPANSDDKLKERQRYEANPERFVKRYQAALKRQYAFVYDELGEETLLKWYQEYPKRYSLEFLERHRIPATQGMHPPQPEAHPAQGTPSVAA